MIEGSMLAMDHMKTSIGGSGGVIVNISSLAGIVEILLINPMY